MSRTEAQTDHEIGGSDVGAILGHNRWRTPLDVYLEKLGVRDGDTAGEAAYWGTELEPKVLARYAEKHDAYVLARTQEGDPDTYQVLTPQGTDWTVRRGANGHPFDGAIGMLAGLRHPELPWATGHPDGLRVDPSSGEVLGGVEAKTSSAWRHEEWGPDSTDEVPRDYVYQVQWYAWLLREQHGLDVPWHMPVLIGGQTFKVYPIAYSPELAAEARGAAEDMVRRLEEGDEPEATAEDDEAVVAMYPEDSGEELVVPPDSDLDRLARRYRAAQLAAKRADERKREARNKIHQRMGDATKLNGDGWSWTWKKPDPREQVDWEEAFLTLVDHVRNGDAPSGAAADDLADEIEAECTEVVERSRRPYPYVRNLEPLEDDEDDA